MARRQKRIKIPNANQFELETFTYKSTYMWPLFLIYYQTCNKSISTVHNSQQLCDFIILYILCTLTCMHVAVYPNVSLQILYNKEYFWKETDHEAKKKKNTTKFAPKIKKWTLANLNIPKATAAFILKTFPCQISRLHTCIYVSQMFLKSVTNKNKKCHFINVTHLCLQLHLISQCGNGTSVHETKLHVK